MTTFSFRGLNPLTNPSYRRDYVTQQLSDIEENIKVIQQKNPPVSLKMQAKLDELRDCINDDEALRSFSQIGSKKTPTHIPRWLREEVSQLKEITQSLSDNYR